MSGKFFLNVDGRNIVGSFVEGLEPDLPEIKYAYRMSLSTASTSFILFGWDWLTERAPTVMTPFDASQFAGFSFWMKLSVDTFPSIMVYDSYALSPELGGTCDMKDSEGSYTCRAPRSTEATAPAVDNWRHVVVRFGDLSDATNFDPSKLMRVELIKVFWTVPHTIWITGVELLKGPELPPR